MRLLRSVFLGIIFVIFGISNTAHAQWYSIPGEPDFPFPTIPTLPPTDPSAPPPDPTTPPPYTPPTSSTTGATTLFVGSPGSSLNRLNGYGISTSDIDPILDQYTGLGPSFTRDISNDAFDDLADLKQNVRTDLTTAINSINRVSVNSLSLTINPIKARLTQNGTSVGVKVGGLDASASIRYDLPWPLGHCNASLSISDISIGASYDVYSGNINDSNIDVSVDRANVSCDVLTSILIPIIPIIDIFVNETGLANNAIEDAIMDFTGIANMQTLFSIRDFLDSTRSFGDVIENTANNFPQSVTVNTTALGDLSDLGIPSNVTIDIPQFQGDISDEFNMVVDTVQQIIGGFAGTSLQLDISVFDGPQNQISFLASHQASDITHLEYGRENIFINVRVPANTNKVEIFAKYPYSQNWSKIKTQTITPSGNSRTASVFVRGPDRGTRLVAVGTNSLVGLRGFPGRGRTSTWDFNCIGSTCPNLY